MTQVSLLSFKRIYARRFPENFSLYSKKKLDDNFIHNCQYEPSISDHQQVSTLRVYCVPTSSLGLEDITRCCILYSFIFNLFQLNQKCAFLSSIGILLLICRVLYESKSVKCHQHIEGRCQVE